ncbi:MAG: hypothetical protein LBT09_07085, partial [Planctomycetaceae bacterium]|nr:hypothetical protein [Planctomycetaceae bacterium]
IQVKTLRVELLCGNIFSIDIKALAGKDNSAIKFQAKSFADRQPLNLKRNHLQVGNLSPKGCVGVLADKRIANKFQVKSFVDHSVSK